MHCSWKPESELTEDRFLKTKIARFEKDQMQHAGAKLDDDVTEPFPDSYCEVDRIIDIDDEEGTALVKWQGLPYEESTWESIAELKEDEAVAACRKRQDPPSGEFFEHSHLPHHLRHHFDSHPNFQHPILQNHNHQNLPHCPAQHMTMVSHDSFH